MLFIIDSLQNLHLNGKDFINCFVENNSSEIKLTIRSSLCMA